MATPSSQSCNPMPHHFFFLVSAHTPLPFSVNCHTIYHTYPSRKAPSILLKCACNSIFLYHYPYISTLRSYKRYNNPLHPSV